MQGVLAVGFVLTVRYTNYRGETAHRRIKVMSAAFWGATEWHPEPQWLIWVFDIDKQERRAFAMRDMVPMEP